MEWSEFTRRLGRELAVLERDTILIVRERDESRHYVQAMRESDRLYAEAVSNNFLDGPLLLTPADEEVMSEAGWRPPSDPTPRNWWTELPEFGTPGGMRSVTGGDFSRLADVMVTALRDVQGIRRPADLVYESFHRSGTGLIELIDFGIDVADPARVNKRRASSGPPTTEPLEGAAARPADAAGTPPAGLPTPIGGAARMDADPLEPRLAEAKANGDNTTYFRLLASADLVLPATAPAVEDPDRAEFPTITIGSSTYVTAFTSPSALARSGDRHPGLYRRTSFARLAAGWPDPTWRLAINWGLPSEVLLNSSVIGRLHFDPGATPSPVQDVPNPYGTVDPTALAGPNPVAGESQPAESALNGFTADLADTSGPGSTSGPGGTGGADGDARDDSHTAIDPYPAADLRATLDSETDAPGKAEPGPAEPDRTTPLVPEPRSAEPAHTEFTPAERTTTGPTPTGPTPTGPTPTGPTPAEPVTAEPKPAPLGAPTNKARVAPKQQPAGVPMRLPHGTHLWRSAGADDETPLAVYDAISGAWTPVSADTVPAPRAE